MNLLVVEDDIPYCETLDYLFQKEHIHATFVHDGSLAQQEFANPYDMILLDCMLPDINGIELLKELRLSNPSIPVIMITALGSLNNKLDGFRNGADDYIVKPFEFQELMARIQSLMKRCHNTFLPLSFGDLTYHPGNAELSCSNDTVTLSPKELALFKILLEHGENVVSRDDLILSVWGENAYQEDGNLDNFIYFLRRHLRTIHSHVQIKNIHGIGFKLTKE
ncbi:MAG: response regulator transcription factor [Lachnospiraceae bacterium]|nr:response regulator transcription factor [Lachnospiraceae bacterium]